MLAGIFRCVLEFQWVFCFLIAYSHGYYCLELFYVYRKDPMAYRKDFFVYRRHPVVYREGFFAYRKHRVVYRKGFFVYKRRRVVYREGFI